MKPNPRAVARDPSDNALQCRQGRDGSGRQKLCAIGGEPQRTRSRHRVLAPIRRTQDAAWRTPSALVTNEKGGRLPDLPFQLSA